MINSIVNTFRELSKEHKLVRSFKYDRLSKGAGTGEENMPQVFLEDPIYISDSTLNDGSVRATVNLDVVMIPQAFENSNVKQLTVEECQNVAHAICLNFVARLREISKHPEDFEDTDIDTSLRVLSYSFLTLRKWYDDDAAGVRMTLLISVDNPIYYCDTASHFDPDKDFEMGNLLSKVNTDDPAGCVDTWSYKLPKINL